MPQEETEEQKKAREAKLAKHAKQAGAKKGEQGTGKIDMSKKFVPKENKPLPTMEEILKKKRGSAADAEAEEEAKKAKKKGKKQGIDY